MVYISRRNKLYRCFVRNAAYAGILVAIGGLGSASAYAQGSAQAPESIFGTYGRSSPGRDSIRVLKTANSKIGLVIELYYANGHICRLTADGEWGDGHVTVVADGLDPSRPCKLNAFFSNGRVSLKDDGLQCAPVYCGSRGKLDDVSLAKSTTKRK